MLHKLLAWLFDQYTEVVAATSFLSVLPLPGASNRFETSSANEQTPHLGSAYFPFVGFLLATVLYLVQLLFGLLLPRLALAAVLVVALVLLTGGLHLDGVMDTCDGMFGGKTRERRLEIMRDSRVGSFGVLGGACILLLKFALFASIESHTQLLVFFIMLPCARWAMVLALRVFPSARPDGLGVAFRQSVTSLRLIVAGVTALLFALAAGHIAGMLTWCVATCVALMLGVWSTRMIGGLTGDIYGAIAECSEVVMLLLLVCLHAFM
ncbi:MAG: adenosylcobinamide-GDP ribazoletransferase [Ktedonobacteraceae bacterium]